ncbi:uncharacterized protein LOC114431857 isoform X2 [Parambassis ranga]|uniref:Uncharacterized protein LOC114431857 isoform X2 n=1 Tax=Parambassis ranga TaxID=210632 RepID=A0A6P7HTF3_9TELE|nr:uncharacterized protein LOC114431857 isoform X2 [Parambassis ranga]
MSYTSSPLLLDLLEGKLFNLESSSSTISMLEKTSTNVETTKKSSLLSINDKQKVAQNPDYSGVTDQSSSQKMSPFSPSSLPFLKEILAGGEPRPFTDEEINCVIKKILEYFLNKSLLTKDINNGLQVHSLQTSNSIPATIPTESLQEDVKRRSLSHAAIEQCTSAARGAIKENGQKDSKAGSQVKGHKDNLEIVQGIAATSTKNKESRLVVTTVSKEYLGSTHSCISSQDWSNTDKNQHAGGKAVKRAQLDSVTNMSPGHSQIKANNSNPREQPMLGQTSANPSMVEHCAYMHSLPPLPHPVTVVKNALYEDISDSEGATQTPNEWQNELQFSALSQYSVCEGISEDNDPLTSLTPELSKPSIQQYGHVMCADVLDEDQTDDWLVIPLVISEIKFESGDEDQKDQEVVELVKDGEERRPSGPVLPKPRFPAPNPAPVSSLFCPIEEYDTIESFKQANISQYLKRDLAQESSIACDPEDSCETEDSSDYSDDSEHNYLTVSRKLLTLSSAASSKTDESDEEKDNLKRCKTRRRKKPKREDVIVLNSDSEDSNSITRPYRDKESVDTYYNNYAASRQNLSSDESVIVIEDNTDQNYGEGASPSVGDHETAKHCLKSLASSDASRGINSGQPRHGEVKSPHLKKKAKTNRRILSTDSEESDKDTRGSFEAKNMLCKTSPLSKKEPHPVGMVSPTTLGPNPVIPRYAFTQVSSTSVVLNRLKPTVQKHKKAMPLQTSKETSKTAESSKAYLKRNKKGQLVSKPDPTNQKHHTSTVSQMKQSSSNPRLHCPNKTPSALRHSYTTTKAPSSTTKPLAVERLTREWERSYYPTRRDKKTGSETEEAIPGPSRSERVQQRRQSYQEPSVPLLMKRSKDEARQLTANATNRISHAERRYAVGEGYKWRNSSKGGSTKRGRSPPICLDWDEDPSSSYVCYN